MSNIGGASKKTTTTPSRSSERLRPSNVFRRDHNQQQQQQQDQMDGSFLILAADPDEGALASKHMVRKPTGLASSAIEQMNRHRDPLDPHHIECPERLDVSLSRVKELGLDERCQSVPAVEATDDQLLLFHSQKHLDDIKDLVSKNADEANASSRKMYDSVYFNQHSLVAARLAAGTTINLVTEVVQGRLQNGMALVRPPGHHSMVTESNGFCIFNNVALAAKHAVKNLGLSRVLIVDFDVHHGQGIQRGFYDDPKVFYMSAHRYERGSFWPFLRESDFDHVGSGSGAGFTANVPLNETKATDSDYLDVIHKILLPLAHEFRPELILLSAGYDCLIGDPEGQMEATPGIYGHLVHSLSAFANGKVVAILEGGYYLNSLAEGVTVTLSALLGDPLMPLGSCIKPSNKVIKGPRLPSVEKSVLSLKTALKPHWQNMRIHEEHSDPKEHTTMKKHRPVIIYRGSMLLRGAAVDDVPTYFKEQPPEEVARFESILGRLKSLYSDRIERCRRRQGMEAVVALAYDESMMRHVNQEDPSHVEKPERIERIFQMHRDFGLLDRLHRVNSRRAKEEDVSLVHEFSHWETMEQLPGMSQEDRVRLADSLDSIYLNEHSFDCALLAAGNTLEVVDAVCDRDSPIRSGVAIVRPPGHHAEDGEANGFCIFNNVAIAARYAQVVHEVERVMILDWDVHHGNGIQNAFYKSNKVLYVSLHRFDRGTFFPGKPDAGANFIGSGVGAGYNVNIPWNGSGVGDTDYALAMYNVVLPVAHQFDPQLVLVSAGFDAARGDPLGRCKVSPEMYAHMTHQLMGLADGKVILVLEGGYNLNSISLGMTLCTKALLGDPLPALPAPYKPPLPNTLETIREVLLHQSSYWPCLDNVSLPSDGLAAQMLEVVIEKPSTTPAGGPYWESLKDGDESSAEANLKPGPARLRMSTAGDSEYIPSGSGVGDNPTSGITTLSFNRISGSKFFESILDSSNYQLSPIATGGSPAIPVGGSIAKRSNSLHSLLPDTSGTPFEGPEGDPPEVVADSKADAAAPGEFNATLQQQGLKSVSVTNLNDEGAILTVPTAMVSCSAIVPEDASAVAKVDMVEVDGDTVSLDTLLPPALSILAIEDPGRFDSYTPPQFSIFAPCGTVYTVTRSSAALGGASTSTCESGASKNPK